MRSVTVWKNLNKSSSNPPSSITAKEKTDYGLGWSLNHPSQCRRWIKIPKRVPVNWDVPHCSDSEENHWEQSVRYGVKLTLVCWKEPKKDVRMEFSQIAGLLFIFLTKITIKQSETAPLPQNRLLCGPGVSSSLCHTCPFCAVCDSLELIECQACVSLEPSLMLAWQQCLLLAW